MINRFKQGDVNRRLILEFLTLNKGYCYDVNELSKILNINQSSVRTHCINLVNSGQLIETYFYKHSGLRPRKIAHYYVM